MQQPKSKKSITTSQPLATNQVTNVALPSVLPVQQQQQATPSTPSNTISVLPSNLNNHVLDNDNTRRIFDFTIEMVKNFGDVLKLGMTFCFGIMAALSGYVLSQDLEEETRSLLIICAFLLSALALCAGIAVGWSMFKGINTLQSDTFRYSEQSEMLRITTFIRSVKFSVVIMVTISVTTLLMFSSAMYISHKNKIAKKEKEKAEKNIKSKVSADSTRNITNKTTIKDTTKPFNKPLLGTDNTTKSGSRQHSILCKQFF